MSQIIGAVTASTRDYQIGWQAGSSTSLLSIQETPDLGLSTQGRADLDTSGIGSGQVISAATLYWYNDSDSSTAGKPGFDHRIRFVFSTEIYQSTVVESAGWNSQALTVGEFTEINTDNYTTFEFWVPDPGAGKSRAWGIRAWDYTDDDTWSIYLVVDYDPAPDVVVRRGRAIVIG